MIHDLTPRERRLAEGIAVRTVLPVEGVEIMAQVAHIFGLGGEEIVGDRRTARVVDARKVIAYILDARGWTHTQIGELLNRSTSTAHHLVQAANRDFDLRRLAKELAA